MPVQVRVTNKRSKARFVSKKCQNSVDHLELQHAGLHGNRKYKHLTFLAMEAGAPNLQDGPKVPPVYIKCTPVQDDLQTSSSTIQNSTVEECLPYLTGDGTRGLFDFDVHGLPSLDRLKHIEFLHDCLGDLPSAFVAYDAARPWVLYWSLVGLSLLGEDVHQYRSR